MEMKSPRTDATRSARVGASVPTCLDERSLPFLSNRSITRQFPVRSARLPIRGLPGLPGSCLFLVLLFVAGTTAAQSSGKTVRHHKVEVDDPNSPAELIQGETAIEKKDFATAEALLKKVVADDPQNFAAWFDLGFVYNALGRTDDAIAAYRKSVSAKPSVFESNLNLGLTLVKAGQPEAERFLRAATRLKPSSNVQQGQARAWLSLGHVVEAKDPEAALEAYTQ